MNTIYQNILRRPIDYEGFLTYRHFDEKTLEKVLRQSDEYIHANCREYRQDAIKTTIERVCNIVCHDNVNICITRYNENYEWIKKLNNMTHVNVCIYNKGTDIFLPHCFVKNIDNVSFEDFGILSFIIDNYQNLQYKTIFLHGYIDQCPSVLNSLKDLKTFPIIKCLVESMGFSDTYNEPYEFRKLRISDNNFSCISADKRVKKNFKKLFGIKNNDLYAFFCSELNLKAIYPIVYIPGAIFSIESDQILSTKLETYKMIKDYIYSKNKNLNLNYFESKFLACIMERLWLIIFCQNLSTLANENLFQCDYYMFEKEVENVIQNTYSKILQRKPSKSALEKSKIYLNTHSIESFENLLKESNEYKLKLADIVTQTYWKILHRQPDNSGLITYCKYLETHTIKDLENVLYNSEEYKIKKSKPIKNEYIVTEFSMFLQSKSFVIFKHTKDLSWYLKKVPQNEIASIMIVTNDINIDIINNLCSCLEYFIIDEQNYMVTKQYIEFAGDKCISNLPNSLVIPFNEFQLIIARYKEDIKWCENFKNVIIYNKGPNSCTSKCTVIDIPNIGREGNTYLNHIIQNYHSLHEYTIFSQGDPFEHSSNFDEFISMSFRHFKPVQPLSYCWKENSGEEWDSHHKTGIPPMEARELTQYLHLSEIGKIHVEYLDRDFQTVYPYFWQDGGFNLLLIPRVKKRSSIKSTVLEFVWKYLGIINNIPEIFPFCYSALFGICKERIIANDKMLYENLNRFLLLHADHGYILERLWLLIFSISHLKVRNCEKKYNGTFISIHNQDKLEVFNGIISVIQNKTDDLLFQSEITEDEYYDFPWKREKCTYTYDYWTIGNIKWIRETV